MSASEHVGTVEALWRFPVKSMLGERLDVGGPHRGRGGRVEARCREDAQGKEVEERALGHDGREPTLVEERRAERELPRDPGVLKALGRHNRLEIAGSRYPCAGVYAIASATGTVRTGDPVSLI